MVTSNVYDTHAIPRPLNSELTLRPLTSAYDPLDQRDAIADRASVRSFETYGTSSSGNSSSFRQLKRVGNRIRGKPLPSLPRYLSSSVRRHPAAEIETTRTGRGLWKDQLLVDRSLRTMAVTTSVFAVGMLILIVSYAQYFRNRANPNSSSVGGDTRSCEAVTKTNTALLLLINVCATMVLGMSNTYQQLVTSLTVSDLKYVLSRFGDSKVGTNSPFSINHKKDGRKRAWSAWFLLVFTSMPIHFLANSLIGPSYIQTLPEIVEYKEHVSLTRSTISADIDDSISFPCWSALRTGKSHYPRSTRVLSIDTGIFGATQMQFDATWNRIQVHYDSANCSQSINTTTDLITLEESWATVSEYEPRFVDGYCELGYNAFCTLHDPGPAKCRLNVRMSAAFILGSCLLIKAVYMCTINLLARDKPKTQCLTFGDVIVASASHTELRVQGECMVNAGDGYRSHNSHTCHRHCKNPDESETGDEIGHCQKCKKWNSTDKFSNLPQPTIATKIKKSLISNLGNTALTQMCILMLCSMVLTGASLYIAFKLGTMFQNLNETCEFSAQYNPNPAAWNCNMSATARFEMLSGGFGGFNRSLPLYSMEPDKLSNEFLSFSVSNGAQFIYSLLYLMMIYNVTLVSQERDWGRLEHSRKRIRCTLVAGESFSQDYLLQLPKKILFPIMAYSVLTHWMLGEAFQTQEAIWLEDVDGRHIEHSKYIITFAAYPVWIATFLILLMTSVCWWAFTYTREGFIPQMYGSVRALCASTTQLDDFPSNGVQWGDLGQGKQFRNAGLSAEDVLKIVPNELYAGTGEAADNPEVN